jgi:hypothetical protein
MSVISLRVNVPVLLAVEEHSGDIIVLNTLVPDTLLDSHSNIVLDNYEMLTSGVIYETVGTQMTTFAANQITDYVSRAIVYKPGTKVKSVAIKIMDDDNISAINAALANVQLPAVQPDVVQLVFTFVLSNEPIDTSDYSYVDGKRTWTMGINLKKPAATNSVIVNTENGQKVVIVNGMSVAPTINNMPSDT